MGTSTDRSAGRGGAWTPLKYAATSYTRGVRNNVGDAGKAGRVLARHVSLFGGAGGAVSSAIAGRNGLSRLGALVAGIGDAGLAPTLQDLGLGQLVGQDRFEVLDELVTLVGGDGNDFDSQAARDAACDALEALFDDAGSWEELSATTVSTGDIERILRLFLAAYVYNRVPVIAERLARLTDPEAARQADAQFRQIIEDLVVIHLGDAPLTIDWSGPAGRQITDDAITSVYEALEALEGTEP